MNWLDIVLGVVLAGSTVAGGIKGFARTAIGITTTILALLLSLWFYGAVGSIFQDYVSSKVVSNLLGFAIVFVLVILAGSLVGKLIATVFKWAGLSWLDRTLGACFGFVRGLLFSTILVMILMAFSIHPPPKAVQESALSPYVLEAADVFSKLAPRELTEGFRLSYEKLKEIWKAGVGSKPKKTTY